LLAAGIAYSAVSGCNAVLDSMQNAARQRLVVAWHQALGQWVRFSAALALIKCVAATSAVAMAGYTAAAAVVLASQLVLFRRGFLAFIPTRASLRDRRTARAVEQMWTYGWPFASWGLFTWAQTASDRWALQMFRPTQEVGLYQVLYQIGYYPISLLTGLLVQLVAPILFESVGRGTSAARLAAARQLNRSLTAGALCLTAVAASVAALFHEPIFSLLAAREYAGASRQLPWITLSGGLFAAGQIAVLERLSHTNTKTLIAPKIVTAVAGVALNAVAARYWGLGGVVRAGAVVSLAYLTWIWLLNRNAGADAGRIEAAEAAALLPAG
jgi:O-antigen/teichoic acid export membrane protein